VFGYSHIDNVSDSVNSVGLHSADGCFAVGIGKVPAGNMTIGFETASFLGRRDDFFGTADPLNGLGIADPPRVAWNPSPTRYDPVDADTATACFVGGDLPHGRQPLYYATEFSGDEEASIRR
jgi:hypothetical protein